METCAVDGCEGKRGKRRGYCGTHYNRWREGKDLGGPIRARQPRVGNCAVEACERPVERRGYCGAHYGRLQTGRDLHAPIREFIDKDAPCSIDECERPRRTSEWCNAHYQRLKKGRDLATPVRRVILDRPSHCSVEGCERRHSSHGYCAAHAARWKKHGSPEPRDTRSALTRAAESGDFNTLTGLLLKKACVDENGCWVWPKLHKDKYPMTRVAGGPLHRAVVEVKHGKPLGSQPVHHICANTACVNPDHLQPVTHAENIAEMMARKAYMERIEELEQALAAVMPEHPVLNRVPLTKAS